MPSQPSSRAGLRKVDTGHVNVTLADTANLRYDGTHDVAAWLQTQGWMGSIVPQPVQLGSRHLPDRGVGADTAQPHDALLGCKGLVQVAKGIAFGFLIALVVRDYLRYRRRVL